MMACIMQMISVVAKLATHGPVHVAGLPTIHPAEQTLARHERFEMRGDVRPRPLGYTRHAIAAWRLRAARVG
jgi:hypothetical protein